MLGWMKSSRLWKILRSLDPTSVLTASLLNAALWAGIAFVGVRWMGADPLGTAVVAIFCSIIGACILMAEGENRDRNI